MVIRELDLVKLGFNKVVVSEEESGTAPYYFYEYPLSEENENFVLVSEDSDEIKDDTWRVQLFDTPDYDFYSREALRDFIECVTKFKSEQENDQ